VNLPPDNFLAALERMAREEADLVARAAVYDADRWEHAADEVEWMSGALETVARRYEVAGDAAKAARVRACAPTMQRLRAALGVP
jgi:hypothetical protein